MFKRQAGLTVAAIAAAFIGVDPGRPRSITESGISPYANHTGHAGHWQGHQGQKKTERARAAKKVAHASRVRNRPKKAKKWSGRITIKTRMYERNLKRIQLLEARTYTTGYIS
jgi:hypothetical protein